MNKDVIAIDLQFHKRNPDGKPFDFQEISEFINSFFSGKTSSFAESEGVLSVKFDFNEPMFKHEALQKLNDLQEKCLRTLNIGIPYHEFYKIHL